MQNRKLLLFYINFPPFTFSEALLGLVFCYKWRGNFNTFYLADNKPGCFEHSPSHSKFSSKYRPPATSPKLVFLLLHGSVAIRSVSKTCLLPKILPCTDWRPAMSEPMLLILWEVTTKLLREESTSSDIRVSNRLLLSHHKDFIAVSQGITELKWAL